MFETELSQDELKRYSRHILIPDVGMDGQKKLKQAKVLIVGVGGLGSIAGLYLEAAGVGVIGLVDFDMVDETNLHRQTIYTRDDVGKKKVFMAKQKLIERNPNLEVKAHDVKLTKENAVGIIANYDLVIDGSDNFATRYIVNDVCLQLGKPNVYGSIFQFEGQASVFNHNGSGCYRCVYNEPPKPGTVPSCAEAGVLGVLPGIIGLIQATEAIKIILGKGETLSNRLLLFDGLKMSFRELKFSKRVDCKSCGLNRESVKSQESCNHKTEDLQIEPRQLKYLMQSGEHVTLLDVREPSEYEICRIRGSKLIPLGDLENQLDELNKNSLIVAYCHHGSRSMMAVDLLRSKGFVKLKNLSGGIDGWAEDVEPSMPKY